MAIRKVTSAQYGPGVAEVDTASGRVRGMIRNDVYCYLGIKYADAERFQVPHAPASWQGVRDCLMEGPICPSFNYGNLPPVGSIQCPTAEGRPSTGQSR